MCNIYYIAKDFQLQTFLFFLTLIWVGGILPPPLPPPPLLLISDICANFGIADANSDRGISDFWISSQSLVKENCHNSRTSDGIYMELGPLTKLEEWNKTMPKKLTITPCQQIMMSLSFFQFMSKFGAIQKPHSGHTVC